MIGDGKTNSVITLVLKKNNNNLHLVNGSLWYRTDVAIRDLKQ
jgi:hypothetical protein